MAFKPNYNQQRAERDRLKKAKKEEKLKRRQEAHAQPGSAGDEPGEEPAPDAQDEPSA